MSELRARITELSRNYWWSWNASARYILGALDRDLWQAVERNPAAFLREADESVFRAAERDPRILAAVMRLEEEFHEYMGADKLWARRNTPGLFARPVAYFSPEFCIHESLPIYSGGLGVLAGDHLKSCSDLGLPTVGVSLFYRGGYFQQRVDGTGRQVEVRRVTTPEELPLERARTADGKPVSVTVPLDDSEITADVWVTHVGRVDLLLLDVRDDRHHEFPGALELYGGDSRTRLFQEVVLGIGGYRALRALGIHPGVIHLNEGHSAFATLEAAAEHMEESGVSFYDAVEEIAPSVVFTTHTPVDAGHDRFTPGDLLYFLKPTRERLGISDHEMLALGRVDPNNEHEPFCMTTLAMKLSCRANGVSALHGRVSRRMWQSLWPTRRLSEVPIGHVTNGVHIDTWLAPELSRLYGECMGADWREHVCDPDRWRRVEDLDPAKLWITKLALKRRLAEYVEVVLTERNERLGLTDPVPAVGMDCLTIGFARRFAMYKRAMLLFSDLDRVKKIMTDPERPVQILIGGKAHPADEPGKAMIERLTELSRDPELSGRLIFLEGYDKTLSRMMVEGCDLWLNNPRRPLEACGTSGMKAAMNATLNASTLDGWWDEAYDTLNGFAFGDGQVHADPAVQDARDAESLYEVLENEVVPLFYVRDEHGAPMQWLERAKHALATLGYRFNADRMVKDYARGMYLPASNTPSAEFRR